MSVNPDDMNMAKGVATEYVDLEHQVIRQKLDFDQGTDLSAEVGPGDPGGTFTVGERQLDREEIAQLVYYRRYASINFLDSSALGDNDQPNFAIVDASVGVNGDLFRESTTEQNLTIAGNPFRVDTGGEIGLLDNYTVFASPSGTTGSSADTGAFGGTAQVVEHSIDYYSWPTGGPILDSFDEINCGFAAGLTLPSASVDPECQIELRYDFYWDVAEQGRSTNPFGRPSTR